MDREERLRKVNDLALLLERGYSEDTLVAMSDREILYALRKEREAIS